jgi:protoporphyrinogen/coproporphyrinogen III oxidase
VGGPEHEALLALDDEALIAVVREELGEIMGLRAEPLMARVFRWQQANPQYDVGHLARVRTLFDLAQAHPGLFLTGSSYEGVGVPDCVRQGREAAWRVLDYLPQAQGAEPVRAQVG